MPKTREIELIVDASPLELRERLRGSVRFRLLPYQSSILGTGGLGGRVSPEGFTVSLDDRRVLQSVQAVASGKIEPTATGGSKVTATLGIPPWLTLALRLSLGALPFYLGMVAWLMLQQSGLAVASGFLGVFLAIAVGTVGWMVNRADDSLPELEQRLTRALEGPTQIPGQTESQPQEQGKKKAAGRHKQRG